MTKKKATKQGGRRQALLEAAKKAVRTPPTRVREAEPEGPHGVFCAFSGCGKPFTPTRGWQRYCTDRCRVAAWNEAHPRVDLSQAPPRKLQD